MKRVLIITYYWPPSGGAGVQRWLKFSKFLPDFGWDPIILTVDPKKATYPVKDDSLQQEIRDDIKVIKTDSTEWFSVYKKVSGTEKVPYAGFANETKETSLKQKAARFFRGNFFIPDPRKGWNKHAIEAGRKIIQESKVDCIISTGPPHSSQLIGLQLADEFSLPWIADFRDPWTDIYYYKQFYPTFFAHRLNLKMERSVLKNASRVLTVSPSWKILLENKLSDNRQKVRVLTNGFDPDNFKKELDIHKHRFIVTYIGTMAGIYPIDSFLEAFASLIGKNPQVLLRFIGTISQDQKVKITRLPQENYEIIPYVNHSTAIDYLYDSSVLLLIIPSHSSSMGIVPGKIFEYIAVGKPILYLGPEDSDGAKIISEGNSGRVIESTETVRIQETLHEWATKTPIVEPNKQYSRKNLTQSLANIMNEIA